MAKFNVMRNLNDECLAPTLATNISSRPEQDAVGVRIARGYALGEKVSPFSPWNLRGGAGGATPRRSGTQCYCCPDELSSSDVQLTVLTGAEAKARWSQDIHPGIPAGQYLRSTQQEAPRPTDPCIRRPGVLGLLYCAGVV